MTTLTGTRRKQLYLFSLFFLMVVYAVSVTMIGPLMGPLLARYRTGLAGGGLLITFQSAGGILAILAAGAFTDRVRKQLLIGGSILAYALALLAVGTAPVYPLLLAVFFALGGSTRILDAVTNAIVADLYPENRGKYLNILHTFFGLGAFLGPLYVQGLLTQNLPWNGTFLLLGFLCLLFFLLYLAVMKLAAPVLPCSVRSSEAAGKSAGEVPGHPFRLLGEPRVLAVMGIMFLYVGHQAGVSVWLPLYMETTLSATPFLSSLALSLFWIGIILGRIAASFLSRRTNPAVLLALGGLVGGVLLTGAFLLRRTDVLLSACLLTGIVTGAVIPLLVTLGTGWYPARSGAVSSLIFLSGTFARMLFPWLMGVISESLGFTTGISLSSVVLILLFLLALPLVPSRSGGRNIR